MTRVWTLEQLAALEKPVRRACIGKRVVGGPSERTIQRGIVKSLRKLGIFCVHVANEGNLAGGFKQWAALKADGCVEGFPDLVCIDRDGALALFEVKRPGGSLNDAQTALLPKLKARCPRVQVVTSIDEVMAHLRSWGWLNA